MTDVDENEQIAQRRTKLAEHREQGNAFPNDFRRDALAAGLHAEHGEREDDDIKDSGIRVKVAGRLMTRRIMGKASFCHIQDSSGRIQCYLRRDDLPEGIYQQFKRWDIGDIIAVEGLLFKTRTGELSVHGEQARLLTKALRPLPEKFHGLSDQETRYRQRYLDLIMSEDSRDTFRLRSKLVDGIRRFLTDRDFLEVETPMMQTIPGGAAARPFTTHHNALDMQLYLRIAPELYLKRLVVGGLERVFEINRNFRNEGLSTRHNPEFTMLEFYQAYSDYHELMDLTEAMLRGLAQDLLGTTTLSYQGMELDFGKPFTRMTVTESILHFNDDISADELEDLGTASAIATRLGIDIKPDYGLGKVQIEIFEKTVEERLHCSSFVVAASGWALPRAAATLEGAGEITSGGTTASRNGTRGWHLPRG